MPRDILALRKTGMVFAADTIEEIARDKLGLVKPGEKIFYDMSN